MPIFHIFGISGRDTRVVFEGISPDFVVERSLGLHTVFLAVSIERSGNVFTFDADAVSNTDWHSHFGPASSDTNTVIIDEHPALTVRSQGHLFGASFDPLTKVVDKWCKLLPDLAIVVITVEVMWFNEFLVDGEEIRLLSVTWHTPPLNTGHNFVDSIFIKVVQELVPDQIWWQDIDTRCRGRKSLLNNFIFDLLSKFGSIWVLMTHLLAIFPNSFPL